MRITVKGVCTVDSHCSAEFYEWGWGPSFHFAPRAKGESFAASEARHEHVIALKLGLRPGMHVMDLGAGVGGPAREIARFSGAKITVCLPGSSLAFADCIVVFY